MKFLKKILIVGDAGVGKTNLLNVYVNGKFNPVYRATLGADFFTKELEKKSWYGAGSHLYILQMWDTAGQERFRSLGMDFYRGSDVVILTYDITVRKTFDSIQSHLEELLINSGDIAKNKRPFVILVGLKSDLESRAVSEKRAKEYAIHLKESCGLAEVPFWECSAKENINIENIFLNVLKITSENDRELEIKELVDEVSNLRQRNANLEEANKMLMNRRNYLDHKATKTQAFFRGFSVRKAYHQEVTEKSKIAITKLSMEGKFEEILQLTTALKNKQWPVALKLIHDEAPLLQHLLEKAGKVADKDQKTITLIFKDDENAEQFFVYFEGINSRKKINGPDAGRIKEGQPKNQYLLNAEDFNLLLENPNAFDGFMTAQESSNAITMNDKEEADESRVPSME